MVIRPIRSSTVVLWCVAWLFTACVPAASDTTYNGGTPPTDTATSSSSVTCKNTGATTVVCEGTSGPAAGAEHCPFVGLNTSNGDFSCTTCPTGINWLSGTWMFYQNEPGDAPFLDIFEIEGNHFTETLVGTDDVLAPGVETTAVLKGYFFCPSKSEYSSLRKIFVIESVEPQDGLFGNKAGDTFPCDVLGNGASSSFLLWCDYNWTGNPPLTTQYEYCRKGSTIGGVECVIP